MEMLRDLRFSLKTINGMHTMSLKLLIIIMFSLFLFGILLGVLTASYLLQFNPRLVEDVVNQIRHTIGFAPKPYTIETALNIFIRNTSVTLLTMALGFLIVVPGLIIFINGTIVGFLAYVVTYISGSIIISLASLIPHGIVEVPAILIAAALGTRIGIDLWRYVIKRKKIDTTKTLGTVIKILMITISLLALASIIETYITPYILEKYLGLRISG